MHVQIEGGAVLELNGQPVGRGGEATVYAPAGLPDQLAKVYHRPTAAHAAKLAAMIARPPSDTTAGSGHVAVAWPTQRLLATDGTGLVAGYLMPRVRDALLLQQVLNPKTRTSLAPGFSYFYLLHTARNLAAAVGAVHQTGHVVGDLNESNILVNARALVTLIDTDSFQVAVEGRCFHCPVGKVEYTPRELQSKNLADAIRKPEHDHFGLGVMVFQLLMQGGHPFGGMLTSRESIGGMAQWIAGGQWPYGRQRPCVFKPRPAAPPWESLPTPVQELLWQCFDDGHADPARRPTARDWTQALADAENQVRPCDANSLHYFPKRLAECPWCTMARTFGRDPFPAAPSTVQQPLPAVGFSSESESEQETATETVPSANTAAPSPTPEAIHRPPRKRRLARAAGCGFVIALLGGGGVGAASYLGYLDPAWLAALTPSSHDEPRPPIVAQTEPTLPPATSPAPRTEPSRPPVTSLPTRREPPPPPAWVAAARGLNDASVERRLESTQALALLGGEARGAVPALLPHLADESERVRQATVAALDQIGPPAAADVPALAALLRKDKRAVVRIGTVRGLALLGPEAAAAVPALVATSLRDVRIEVRVEAVAALLKIRPDGAGVIPEYTAAISDPTEAVQLRAVNHLFAYAKTGVPSASAGLGKALAVPSSTIRHRAALHLAELDGAAAVGATGALARALQDPDPKFRRNVLLALAHIGPPAREAVGPLTELLTLDSLELRRETLQVLGAILGGIDPAAADKDENVRRALIRMVELLNDDQVWLTARAALVGVGAAAAPRLAHLLRQEAANMAPAGLRIRAIVTLGELGPNAKKQLPTLRRYAKSKNADLREAARKAIRAVESK